MQKEACLEIVGDGQGGEGMEVEEDGVGGVEVVAEGGHKYC